jgi:hypothetical protein
MSAAPPTAIERAPPDHAERTRAALTDLLGSLVILFAIAADRRTRFLTAAQINDMELAYSRLGRLLSLLRPR